ncbi:hypothetical protein [Candidatus Binatus sp.]|uniref:hypothetical protein n=1 Tax=Candidatus Binatus sp. TaxID=2811406 RepID=UPI003CC6D0A1
MQRTAADHAHRPVCRRSGGHLCQQSVRRGLEPTERLFLHPIGQRAHTSRSRLMRRGGSVQ